MKITELLQNKRILLWGYGLEGKSMERFLSSHADVAECTVFEGKADEIDADKYDYIIKSPGIVTEYFSEKITSMTELFLSEFRDRTIGITGTKGKSTVSSLLYYVLSKCSGRKVLLVGNIGYPCLDYYDQIDADTIVVFEMSCHQLEYLRYSPHIAVLLNLYPEHLDHYGTFEKYAAAKRNIYKWQTAADHLFLNESLSAADCSAQVHAIPEQISQPFTLQLSGAHNQYNAQVVYKISTGLFACDPDAVKAAMSEFHSLPHRMEYVGNYNGIDYYDDSISTIPEATMAAAKSIPHAKTLLIGGMDRGISYDSLIDFIHANPQFHYVLMYASGERIYQSVKGEPTCCYCEDLATAVKKAQTLTGKGEACILSPAAASYGYFDNFEHRGNVFQELVRS